MSAAAGYTPLEILLLFQSLAKFGTEPSSFSRIADILGRHELVREADISDTGRLRPDALRALYTNLLAEEVDDASDPRPGLKERGRHGGTTDSAVLPRLVDRLYARYKDSVVKSIREEESRFRLLRRDISEIERAARGDGGAGQRPSGTVQTGILPTSEAAHPVIASPAVRRSPNKASPVRQSPARPPQPLDATRTAEGQDPGDGSLLQPTLATPVPTRTPLERREEQSVPLTPLTLSRNGTNLLSDAQSPLTPSVLPPTPRPLRPAEGALGDRPAASSTAATPQPLSSRTPSQQPPSRYEGTPLPLTVGGAQHGPSIPPQPGLSQDNALSSTARNTASLPPTMGSRASVAPTRESPLRPLSQDGSVRQPAAGAQTPSFDPIVRMAGKPSTDIRSSASSPTKSLPATPRPPAYLVGPPCNVGPPVPTRPTTSAFQPPATSVATPAPSQPLHDFASHATPPLWTDLTSRPIGNGGGGGGSSIKAKPYATSYDPGHRGRERAPYTPTTAPTAEQRAHRPPPLNTSASSTRWKSSAKDRPLETPGSPTPPPPSPLSEVDSPVRARPRRSTNGDRWRTDGNQDVQESMVGYQERDPGSARVLEASGTRRGSRRSNVMVSPRKPRLGSRASSISQQSTEPRTRSESVADVEEAHSATKVKHEQPSTPAAFSLDNDTEMGDDVTADETTVRSSRRQGRPPMKAGGSPTRLKRKRIDSAHEGSDMGDDSGLDPRIPMLPLGPRYIQCTPNFSRTTAPVLNDITGHKFASLFAHAVKVRDAPGYRDLIYQPQDLKSIKAAIAAGGRAVAAAASAVGTPAGDSAESPGPSSSTPTKNATVLVPPSPDVMPPKGIVNSAQFEKELMRMFANAVMFNPDPSRGFGPALKQRRDDYEAAEEDESLPGNNEEEDGGVVKDTREMFDAVEKTITDWRAAERGRKPPPT